MIYVKRLLEEELKKHLKKKEILAVLGTRQCGKTTMINHFLDELEKKGKKIKRLSFDNLKILNLFEEDIDLFIDKYIIGKEILFIDEVQYSKDSGKKLKYIYDSQKIKIIITGSSAPEISIQCLKYLVGRILLFELYPFNFEEYLSHKDPSLYKIFKKKTFSEISLKLIDELLEDFLTYGGYPKVVLEKKVEDKKIILEGIYSTFILREIKEILELSNDEKLTKLIKALSLQIGNLIEYNSLSKITSLSNPDLKKYLNILDKTYISTQLKPFFSNKGKELVKSPKIYFFDLGFRNTCIDNFTKERSDKGAIYENFIFSELLKKGNKKINFWRTKSKAEVDFILEKEGKTIPIEIKSNISSKNIPPSFRSFLEKYPSKEAYILSRNWQEENKKESNISFLSFIEFISKI